MKNLLIRLLTTLTAGLILAACQIPLPSTGAGSGTVRLTLDSGRTVVADLSSVDHYDITLTQQGFTTLTQSLKPDATGTAVTFTPVPLGTWAVAVTARTAPGNLPVATGSGTLTLSTAGQTVNQSITVALAQTAGGSGNFRLPVQFNTSTGIDFVQASLRPTSSATWTDQGAFAITTDSGVSSATLTSATALTSGTYQLLITFRRGGATGTVAGTFGEAMTIWDNLTSDKWIDSNGSLKPSRTFTDAEFSSANATLASLLVKSAGATVTLTPAFASGTSSYAMVAGTVATVIATSSVEGQTIEVQAGGGSWTPLTSGTESGEISLAAGTGAIAIRVTAPDRATKIYTLAQNLVLNQTTLTLVPGFSGPFALTAGPGSPSITWTSSNTAVATVDTAGKVSAVGTGTTTITATAGSATATCTVTVGATPGVGTVGPGGGFIFTDLGGASSGYRWTEVAPVDTATAVRWTPSNVTVATSNTPGAGDGFTTSIIGQAGTGNGTTYAAYLVKNMTLGGYTDWYLPCTGELAAIGISGLAATAGMTNTYWSSECSSASSAWGYSYSSKASVNQAQWTLSNVRAIRKVYPLVTVPAGTWGGSTVASFQMAPTEVTQAQFQAMMGFTPTAQSVTSGTSPVGYVTPFDAMQFCNKLSAAEGLQSVYTLASLTYSGTAGLSNITAATVTADLTKNGYRLPTYAEWMLASMGGATTAYPWGASTSDALASPYAWYSYNSGSTVHQVATKTANGYGLYDMAGNLWELAWGDATAAFRCGGGYNATLPGIAPSFSYGGFPMGTAYTDNGFRVARGAKTLVTYAQTLTAAVDNGTVALSWNAASGATGYSIYRSAAAGSVGSLVTTLGSGTLSYRETGLSNWVPLSYTVAPTGIEVAVPPGQTTATPVHQVFYIANWEAATLDVAAMSTSASATPWVETRAASGVTVGSGPSVIALDASNKFLYESNCKTSPYLGVAGYTVSSTTGAPGGLVANVNTTVEMEGLGVASPNGASGTQFLYATARVENKVYGWSINNATGALTPLATPTTATLAYPRALSITPNGKFLYTSNTTNGSIGAYSIDPTTGALGCFANYTGLSSPFKSTIDPTGTSYYVTNFGSNVVSQYSINATTGALTLVANTTTDARPIAVTMNPSGTHVYVTTNPTISTTFLVDFFNRNTTTGALTWVATYPCSGYPNAVAVDLSDSYLVVACSSTNNYDVFSINPLNGTLTKKVSPTAGASPNEVKFVKLN